MRGLEGIAQEIMRGGRPGDTPAAAIEWGTWTRQRTVVVPLARLSSAVRSEGLDSPAVVVVGEVVRMREALSWFEEPVPGEVADSTTPFPDPGI